jgi:hypothetical protein
VTRAFGALAAMVGGLLASPLGLLAAIALGPVILGALCAVVFGLIIFAIWSTAVALFLLSRRAVEKVSGRRAAAPVQPD